MSCYSDSCLNGKSSLVQEVKARFEHFVNVVGYKGRVNVDNDGNPEIVTNDRPGMAPSDIDTPESDENNEKTQQQEATPAQLKSDKETTAPKQKTTKGDKKDIKDTNAPYFFGGFVVVFLNN
jgi:hypothetical protein